MLGSGAALPGDCKLVSGNLEKTTIKATYTCPSGEVVVQLAHPDAAPSKATQTEKLAVWVERGTPPADLQSVLASRIRERESEFQWVVYPDATAGARSAVSTLSGALVLGLVVLAGLLLWRRRAATRK